MTQQLALIETNSDYGDELDFYETPTWAAEAIVEVLLEEEDERRFDLLEPAAGRGALIDPFLALHPLSVNAIELDEKRAEECRETTVARVRQGDFFELEHAPHQYPVMVAMNPPYTKPRPTIGLEFVERALHIAGSVGKVVALLPLDFATGVGRCERIHRHHPCSVYPLRRRPNFAAASHSGKRPFAWFVWDKLHPKREWRVIG